ncbi:MAG: GHKL domain-containing protein [Candidatus Omnitrophica bacterium]|nr:GHKL domain-containing protein [Candidatus Omnitrophota bacterium]
MANLKNISEEPLEARASVLFKDHRQQIFRHTDQLFAWLMVLQWLAGIAAAIWISPRAWVGQYNQIHLHVYAAIFLGGLISFPPIVLAYTRPGTASTRYIIAIAQALFSALLIHLTGGRIETHFHVFGSLAFLAFYRDWKVLIPATLVVAIDHWLRGVYWPQSVYGVLAASPWRWLEHAGWVLFEDVFLTVSCLRSVQEMRQIARRTAELEITNQMIEAKVEKRTEQLVKAKSSLEDEITERKKLQERIVQSEKMAAVGQLAAGIAHEINNPVGFIGNNLSVLSRYITSMMDLLKTAGKVHEMAHKRDMTGAEELAQEMDLLEKDCDLEFIRTDIAPLLSESQEGIERIKKIISDLRTFARSDSGVMKPEDLQKVIDGAINIVWNEIKYKAELKKEYGDLPPIECDAQQIGQVVINLLMNAIQSIPEKGEINVRTFMQNGFACIEIKDSGTGIPGELKHKIFDPFFTTKEVGKGTGLGLSISHELIKKHRGKIEVDSEVGKGSTFTVFLPNPHSYQKAA